MAQQQEKSLAGYTKTYTGLVKTLSDKFGAQYPNLTTHLHEIEQSSFDWSAFVRDALPDLQTLAPVIAKMDAPALLDHMRSLPFLTRLNMYELWTSNSLTLNSKKYMWTYLKNLHGFANVSHDIDAPDVSFGGGGAGAAGSGGEINNSALTDSIMKMMKGIDPQMISQIGEVMMKGMAEAGDGAGAGAAPGGEAQTPDLSGISKILESINLPALSQSVLPAFANANETDMQNLFGGIEQVMSVLAKSEQFAGFTDQLTRSLEASSGTTAAATPNTSAEDMD